MQNEHPMRWLYHIIADNAPQQDPWAPPSLSREGFVHASYRDVVLDSARLHFPAGAALQVVRIDPRRLDVPVRVADTPRGPMPHVHGSIPLDAIRSISPLEQFALGEDTLDRVTGTRFCFVAFPGMTALDLLGAYDPISRLRSMGFDPQSECRIVGATTSLVCAQDGARFTVEEIRPGLDGYDVVIVPGGRGTSALVRDKEVAAWLGSFPRNRLMASVCTGALLLGAAGRLAGRRATTHHTALAELAAYGAQPVAQRVVDEGAVVTAGGVTAALDLGLHVVGRLAGEAVTSAIAAQMEYSRAAPLPERAFI